MIEAQAGEPADEAQSIAEATRLIRAGQFFAAHDVAQAGLRQFPGSRRLAWASGQALVRTGALEQARALIEPICAAGEGDEDLLGLMARIRKDQWRRSGDAQRLRESRDIYLQAFVKTGGFYSGINAASMSRLLGEADRAAGLARDVLTICEAAGGRDYWAVATTGEALLLLDRGAEAAARYREAAALAGDDWQAISSSRDQLLLLARHGVAVSEAALDALRPPAVGVFTGHMIDAPGRKTPRFPPEREAAVRAAIDAEIAALDLRIGYSSAACGGDLLFIEAMLDRGAEVNVVLPFAKSDFVETSVRFAGEGWVERFERALERAASVQYVTAERHLGDDRLFGFGNRFMSGLALLRARSFSAEPWLIALWDGADGSTGGTADAIGRWPFPERARLIGGGGGEPARAAPEPPPSARAIKCLLFADMVGFSKLNEEDTPGFVELLRRVAARMEASGRKPEFLNTWGDAIFAVTGTAEEMVGYALDLRASLRAARSSGGVPSHVDLRTGLHAGPVFEVTDPLTGRPNLYGAHVNRAARIEPITVPGEIYASEQFVALLLSETAVRRGAEPWEIEYVGTLALAKAYGAQKLYHLAPRRG
jgi:class 3 adenylate cyclase